MEILVFSTVSLAHEAGRVQPKKGRPRTYQNVPRSVPRIWITSQPKRSVSLCKAFLSSPRSIISTSVAVAQAAITPALLTFLLNSTPSATLRLPRLLNLLLSKVLGQGLPPHAAGQAWNALNGTVRHDWHSLKPLMPCVHMRKDISASSAVFFDSG